MKNLDHLKMWTKKELEHQPENLLDIDLMNYLRNDSLRCPLSLSSNGLLSFHWANWDKTCHFLKRELPFCEKTQQRLQELDKELDALKDRMIWIKTPKKTAQAPLHTLYEAYLDQTVRHQWFEEDREVMVSLFNESGPYMPLNSMRWMDKDIYALFIQRKILTGNFQKRSFRLGMNIPVKVFFDDSSLLSTSVFLYQGSREGMLVKIHRPSDINRFLYSQKMTFHIPIAPFQQCEEAEAKTIFDEFSRFNPYAQNHRHVAPVSLDGQIFKKYNNDLNLKSSDKKSYYFFVRYDDFHLESDFFSAGLSPIKKVVDKVERHFLDILQKNAA